MAGLVISLVSQPQRDKDSDNGSSVTKGWTEDLLKLNMRGCWTTELMWERHFTQCVRFYRWHLSLWFSRSISYYIYWYSNTQLLTLAMSLSNVSVLEAKICRTAHSPESKLILWRVVLMCVVCYHHKHLLPLWLFMFWGLSTDFIFETFSPYSPRQFSSDEPQRNHTVTILH